MYKLYNLSSLLFSYIYAGNIKCMILNIINFELPLADPVIKFLIILLIILFIPIISDKIRIPHLLGMILAGIAIGPHGFNLIARDSSIIL